MLTGNEPWLVAGTRHGETIWAHNWGEEGWWWPIINTEMDCDLIQIDVMGMRETWSLGNCARLRIGRDIIVENENIWDVPCVFKQGANNGYKMPIL